MVRKSSVLILVIAVVALGLMPLCIQEETDALEPMDYKVSTPGFFPEDDMIGLTIGNGHSKTIMIYIQNYTDHVLDIAFYSLKGSDDIYADDILNLTLMPAGDDEGKDLVKQPFTLNVKEITSSNSDVRVALEIFITDLFDDTYSIQTIKFNIDVVSSFDTSGNFNKFLGFIDNTLPGPFNQPIVPFFTTLVVFFVTALLIVKLLVPVLSDMLSDTTSDKDRKRFRTLLTLGIVIAAIALFIDPGLKILGADVNWIYIVNKIAMTILVIVLAVTIWKVYVIFIESTLSKLGRMGDSKVDISLLPLFAMFGKLILWAGGIAAILHIFGMDLSGILISAGIVTLGITLGAQSVLSQFFSGIILLLTRPFSKGDYVVIDDVNYIVKDIKLMYTELFGDEFDRITTMPNNVVASATVVNMTKNDRTFRLYIFIQIPYDIEVEKVEKVLLEVAEESDLVIHDNTRYKKPAVKLIEFQDACIQLRLDVTIKDYASKSTVQSSLKKELYVRLAENGIEMPYNRLEVKILDDVVDEKSTA